MLKGWKRWSVAIISIVVLGAFLAALIYGCVRGSRLITRLAIPLIGPVMRKLQQKFGKRGYQKVGTEEEDIPFQDLERRRGDSGYQELA